ncbi:YbbR-like protein [Mucilaginibacter gracilis]|uniref:YbbR-like protein n=1 Tax=Mucilaginibacter gracilis TaxID=423350 RepID=A0A495J7P3_9SPHI|nr:YbbR-like domain-containing protein [Mucilaginibacter gracilis]RKR84763.1 YbbR-like protein [Mucilaginibacter gracilis]
MAIIKLSKNERRRVSVFFTCLFLAFGAWVLTMLSNRYTYQSKMAVTFVNPPLRRSFRSLQADTVDARVQGSGWDMMFSRMNMQDNHIAVNLKTLDNHNYILLSSQLKAINEKRAANQQILSFDPDTLYFDFSSRAVKRVPVVLQYNVVFKRQFIISDDILLNPNYVTISGPAKTLANINYWKTDSLKLTGVEDPVDQVVRLQPVAESNMSIFPKSVRVHIPVSEFTEKTVEVPVKLINNKNYYNVKIIPQKVKITFTVALNKYAQTDEHAFEAIADLDFWESKGYKQLPVKVTLFPPYCKLVRIEPQNVDFIVKE